jgi:hypothetical protein
MPGLTDGLKHLGGLARILHQPHGAARRVIARPGYPDGTWPDASGGGGAPCGIRKATAARPPRDRSRRGCRGSRGDGRDAPRADRPAGRLHSRASTHTITRPPRRRRAPRHGGCCTAHGPPASSPGRSGRPGCAAPRDPGNRLRAVRTASTPPGPGAGRNAATAAEPTPPPGRWHPATAGLALRAPPRGRRDPGHPAGVTLPAEHGAHGSVRLTPGLVPGVARVVPSTTRFDSVRLAGFTWALVARDRGEGGSLLDRHPHALGHD